MDIVDVIKSLFGGDMVTIILKLVLAGVVGIGAIFGLIWFDKLVKAQAQKKTEEDRAKSQAGLDDKAKPIFDDAKKSEESIEDLIKKRLGEDK